MVINKVAEILKSRSSQSRSQAFTFNPKVFRAENSNIMVGWISLFMESRQSDIQCYLQAKCSECSAIFSRKESLPQTSLHSVAAARCSCSSTVRPQSTFVSLSGRYGAASSNLSESKFVGAPGLFDLQLEGVLIGVVLHDVVIHVHQNPVGKTRPSHSFLWAWEADPELTACYFLAVTHEANCLYQQSLVAPL